MNKLKGLVLGVLLLLPSVSFAATDSDIRASLVQQLLTLFVQEVNGIQAMQDTIGQSSNPAQFSNLSNLLKAQFSDTEGQLAALLNPSTITATTNNSSSMSTNASTAPVSPVSAPIAPSLTITLHKSVYPLNSLYIDDKQLSYTAYYTNGESLDNVPVSIGTFITDSDGNPAKYNTNGTGNVILNRQNNWSYAYSALTDAAKTQLETYYPFNIDNTTAGTYTFTIVVNGTSASTTYQVK